MIKRISVYLILLSQFGNLNAALVISLGEVCSAAAATRAYGIRQSAYPFDWIYAGFESLYEAFQDDFQHFFQENSLFVRGDRPAVIDYYGFGFEHDWPDAHGNSTRNILDEDVHGMLSNSLPDNWEELMPQVYEKYKRRIERLRQALAGSEKVYFIRHCGITKDQAVQLRDLIHAQYPNLDFTLVVVDRSRAIRRDWKLKRIKNFYLDDSRVWNDPQQWKRIFKALGLKPLKCLG